MATSAGGIFVKKDKDKIYLLLLKYTYIRGLGFLKGHIEKDETTEQAAIREIKEEAGLEDVKIVKKIGKVVRNTVEKNGEEVTKTIHLFLMSTSEFNHQQSEEEYDWFEYELAISRMAYKEDAEFLRKIRKNILELK